MKHYDGLLNPTGACLNIPLGGVTFAEGYCGNSANAERAAECWNALHGLNPEALSGLIDAAKKASEIDYAGQYVVKRIIATTLLIDALERLHDTSNSEEAK